MPKENKRLDPFLFLLFAMISKPLCELMKHALFFRESLDGDSNTTEGENLVRIAFPTLSLVIIRAIMYFVQVLPVSCLLSKYLMNNWRDQHLQLINYLS